MARTVTVMAFTALVSFALTEAQSASPPSQDVQGQCAGGMTITDFGLLGLPSDAYAYSSKRDPTGVQYTTDLTGHFGHNEDDWVKLDYAQCVATVLPINDYMTVTGLAASCDQSPLGRRRLLHGSSASGLSSRLRTVYRTLRGLTDQLVNQARFLQEDLSSSNGTVTSGPFTVGSGNDTAPWWYSSLSNGNSNGTNTTNSTGASTPTSPTPPNLSQCPELQNAAYPWGTLSNAYLVASQIAPAGNYDFVVSDMYGDGSNAAGFCYVDLNSCITQCIDADDYLASTMGSIDNVCHGLEASA